MGLRSYKVSVPGSLMFLGEHAVLYGKQAVVVAINHRIKVGLTPRKDNKIKISSYLGDYSLTLNNFEVIKPYDYVLAAIKKYLPKLEKGFTLKIQADFSSSIGFGSSAAVTVATIAVLHRWVIKKRMPLNNLYRKALAVVREVQGCGSGADVAASIFGGVIAYKNKPFVIKKLSGSLPLVVIYSGSKVATAEVIAKVQVGSKKFSKIFQDIYKAIDGCAKAAILAIKNKDWVLLGELMDLHQGLHKALGVSTEILSELVFALQDAPGVYGAKISGSGLGDSIIGLGKIKKNSFPKNNIQKRKGIKQLEVKVTPRGLVHL